MSIQFIVNDNNLNASVIWYHHNSKPRYTKKIYEYIVVVSLDEEKIINKLERMLKVKVSSEDSFLKKALSHNRSSFNLIQYIQDELKCPVEKIKWVFYDIKTVSIEDSKLIIRGIAGKAEN